MKIGLLTPLYKTEDQMDCNNYSCITLTNIVGKICTRILEIRLREDLEKQLDEIMRDLEKKEVYKIKSFY